MEKEFEDQRYLLDVFLQLREGDKLMKNGETLLSVQSGTMQSIRRWWNSETKEKTLTYLDMFFSNFMKFLDNILERLKNREINLILVRKIKEYINAIIPGIHSLKLTYPTYLDLHCKISSIIVTMINFKTESCKYMKTDECFIKR